MNGLYVEGPMGSGKTTMLRGEAVRLLAEKPASSILILCSNHARQAAFIEGLLRKSEQPLAQLPVYTYAGFVRNVLFDYWPLVEAQIIRTLKRGEPRIRPELCGLEDGELILKYLLARLRAEAARNGGEVFENFPGSESHILKQMVRRLRLRSENRLTREEMRERSDLLDEICREEVSWLEREFDRESYRLRVLDPNKQMDVFDWMLRMDNALTQWLRRDIRHLVADDVDETTVAQQRLITWLAPTLETVILAADPDGGSRRGYLNACPYDWDALKNLQPGRTVVLKREEPVAAAAAIHLANWRTREGFKPLPPLVRMSDAFVTRVEMLEQVLEDILALLETGASPGELALILPRADYLGFSRLQNALQQRGIPVQLLSGTRRPIDNPQCKAFISLIQWANAGAWGIRPSRWEIKTVLMQALRLHYLPDVRQAAGLESDGEPDPEPGVTSEARPFAGPEPLARWLFERFQNDETSNPAMLPPVEDLPFRWSCETRERYETLARWMRKAPGLSFDQQLYSAFREVLAPFSSAKDGYGDLNRIIQSYLRQREIHRGLRPILDMAGDITRDMPGGVTWDRARDMSLDTASQAELAGQTSIEEGGVSDTSFDRWWLEQVKNGVVADTPEMPEAIREDAVVIGTPQKVIDIELGRRYQFWLDVGAREWARSDNAPLYNAWVHSAVWDGSAVAFSEEFNEAIIRTRAGHICRTLMLLAGERVFVYASDLDDMGFSQDGLLKPRLIAETPEREAQAPERIQLRPDQAPVLEYQAGTMAISAVPGAGKTFVNVALLLDLISRGVAPDSILVLTYMDSAAKTLLGRLRQKLAGVTDRLPVVSTIHSLAFRILTENDHALLAGLLPDDMRILDDYEQGGILDRVAGVTLPETSRAIGDWRQAIRRGVTHVKMRGLDRAALQAQMARIPGCFRLAEFMPALRLYEQELQQNGLVDFTDLIVKAVALLEDYPDIREKYRRQFVYIIEDEAQDSSRLLQRFIHLLGGDSPNLIRTGDTNQSITTTFSSADTAVFRDFVRDARHRVLMDASSRCAPEIIALANAWIREAGRLPDLDKAFQPVDMRPVEGRNPDLLEALSVRPFETDDEETAWLVAHIRALREKHPEASVAVLLRQNAQVSRIAGLLQQAGVPAVSLSDQQLNAQPVFAFILMTLHLLAAPENEHLREQWRKLALEARTGLQSADAPPENGMSPEASEPDLFETEEALFLQWHYDFMDFERQAAGGNISALIARIADRFCRTVSDRSNGYLCALMAKDILESAPEPAHLSPLEIVIRQFETFRKSWRGRRGFGETLLRNASQVVQVMSVHKSKGQEFEIVFMPFLQAEYYPHELASIRFDESDRLIQDLERVAAAQAGSVLSEAYPDHCKREKIEEEARLIYVGLTRARQALYLSAHRKYRDRYRKWKATEAAAAFRILSPLLAGAPDPECEALPLASAAEEARHAE